MAERERKDDPIVNQKRLMDATIARSESTDGEPEDVILWGDSEPTKNITLMRPEPLLRPLSQPRESPVPTSEPLSSP